MGCAFDQREAGFSLAMGEFWSHFAQHGAPTADGAWPAFTAGAPRNIYLKPDDIKVETNLGRGEACALWDDVARAAGSLL